MTNSSAHILVASLRGGDATSQHTFDLVRFLRGQGMDVRVFYEEFARDLPADIESVASQARYGDYRPGDGLTIVQYAVWFHLAERLRDASGPTLFWYHGVTPPEFAASEGQRVQLQTGQSRTTLAWQAHLAVAASPFTAHELHRLSHYPLDRIQVVPLAVPVADFARPPDPGALDDLRRRWHLEGRRVLIYVGRIADHKGIDLLIDALALLRPTHPDLHLLIVGDTHQNDAARSLTARLRQQAADRNVAGHVTWTGRVPQVEPYYHLAQVAVLPSHHEGFGVPVVEAMAAGVPVIAASAGALPWVIGADGEAQAEEAAGLTFAPGDASDLARQMRRLVDDPTLAADLVRRGRARAERYSHDRFAANVSQVIAAVDRMAQMGPPPGHTADRHPLFDYADIALRGYEVRSAAPVVGRWIAAVRRALTSHVKEAYLDFIVERQVNYNQQLAAEVERLQAEVRRLQAEIDSLRRNPPTG